MFSKAEENYLKAIYTLESDLGNEISTNLIAKKIEAKASSVTDMLKKLAKKELVFYKKYQGVQLTKQGRGIALKVVRKHRLWEYFLVEKLNYSWDKVHDIAEQLEHIQSETLIDKLEIFLDYPKFDPHGDPIPDKTGKVAVKNIVNLLGLKIGESGSLEYVKDSSESFLKYLNKKNLALGDKIRILDIEPFDSSIYVESNSRQTVITKEVAENLFIKI